jgi:hypothetical protein
MGGSHGGMVTKPAAPVLKQSDLVHAAPATMPAAAADSTGSGATNDVTYAQKWRSATALFPRGRASNARTKIFSTIL